MSKSVPDIEMSPLQPHAAEGKPILFACLTLFFIVVVLPLVGCFGWMYIGSIRNCWFPPSSANIQLVVSACEAPMLTSVSPDGRYVAYYLRARSNLSASPYQIIDLRTSQVHYEPRAEEGEGFGYWLDSNLRLVIRRTPEADRLAGAEYSIFNVRDDTQTPIKWVFGMENTLIRKSNGGVEFNPRGLAYRDAEMRLQFQPKVVTWFRNASQVYYIDQNEGIVVALASDWKTNPDNSYVLDWPRSRSGGKIDDNKAFRRFLDENHIPYQVIKVYNDPLTSSGSHDGRLFFLDTTYYDCPSLLSVFSQICLRLVEPRTQPAKYPYTDSAVLSEFRYAPLLWLAGPPFTWGWAYDDSGVIFQLRRDAAFSGDGPTQPILKLNIPKEKRTSAPAITP